jgi:MFS family permease
MGLISVQYSEKLVSRFGARRVLLPGMLLIVAGLAVFAVAPVDATYLVNIFPGATLMGIGAGLCFPPMMGLAMSGVAPTDAGLASGLVNTTAQVGGAIGLAVLATASTGRTSALQASGTNVLDALTGGYHLAFWICAALMAVSFLVALVVFREPAAVSEPVQSEELPELVAA